MINDAPEFETQIWRRALELIRERLPSGWDLELVMAQEANMFPRRPDIVAQLTAPNGETCALVFESKRIVERRDLARIQDALQSTLDVPSGQSTGVLAARYLSPPVRTRLNELGLSYIDATGNMRITLDSPALYIRDRGADNDPWRGAGRPRGTLKGEPAARVVRTLLDNNREWGIKDLVSAAGASVGATYRVVEYLRAEGLLQERRGPGEVAVGDWVRLLRAWSRDYNFIEKNRVRQYIEPRGANAFLARAAESVIAPYAVTGSVAAATWAPYAPARSVFIYVSDAEAAAEAWNLRPSEAAPNILLIEPKSAKDVVFTNTSRNAAGLILAAPSQVAVDLINGPGRNPAEAEELLTWMSANETQWRK